MGFDKADWIGLVLLIVVSYAPFATYPHNILAARVQQEHERRRSRDSYPAPPPWGYSIAWFILFGLIAVAGFLFLRNEELDSVYDTTLAFFFLSLALNALWAPCFFASRPRSALCVLVTNLLFALIVVVLFAVAASNGGDDSPSSCISGDDDDDDDTCSSTSWASFGLYIPFVLWLVYALVLNSMWVSYDNHIEVSERRTSQAYGAPDVLEQSLPIVRMNEDSNDYIFE